MGASRATSFFPTLKRELLDRHRFRTQRESGNELSGDTGAVQSQVAVEDRHCTHGDLPGHRTRGGGALQKMRLPRGDVRNGFLTDPGRKRDRVVVIARWPPEDS